MARKSTALKMVPAPASAPAAPARIETSGGASASCDGEVIVVRDSGGALVVSYDAATGSATIAAPSGDLRLAAPHGRVVVEAGTDLELLATRTCLRSTELELESERMRLRSAALNLASEVLEVSAASVAIGAGRLQVSAERVFEKARDVYRDVEGVIDTRAGRIRSIVRGAWQAKSESTSIVSKEDTFIDGRRVLLG